jgi:hypothetical protein
VHIEHTVPVRVLTAALTANAAKFLSTSDLHRFLIAMSICVAFSHQEEEWLREAGIPASTNPAFDASGHQRHAFPFRRYLPLVDHAKKHGDRFAIVNVVSGEEIDLKSFSFDDHATTLQQASALVTQNAPALYDLELFDTCE